MKTTNIFISFTIGIALVSCSSNEYLDNESTNYKAIQKSNSTEITQKNIEAKVQITPENGLDWDGTYEGIVQGKKQILTLNNNRTYSIQEYTGQNLTYNYGSTFAWDSTGSIITLNGINNYQYFVSEGKIIHIGSGAILIKRK